MLDAYYQKEIYQVYALTLIGRRNDIYHQSLTRMFLVQFFSLLRVAE